MKQLLTLIFVSFKLTTYSQDGIFNPFKLIVLKPDTAIIDKLLYADIDSVQSDYIKRYITTIQQMEQLISSNNFPEDSSFKLTQQKRQLQLDTLRTLKTKIKMFKYYHTISSYSTAVYKLYFNEYEPFSTIDELPYQKTDILSLHKLSDSLKADYIVFFSNIHTKFDNSLPLLKLTTSLYSRKKNKIILIKETEGDINSRGDLWTCGNTTLSCLLINGVRSSTNEVAPVIVKAQRRK